MTNTGNEEIRRRLLACGSDADVLDLWRERERVKQAAGEHHHTTILDPHTGETVARLSDPDGAGWLDRTRERVR